MLLFDIILSDEEEAIMGESSLNRNRSRRCLLPPSADDDDGAAPLDRRSAPRDSRNVCVSPRLPEESSLLLWIGAPPPQPDSPWLLLRNGRDTVVLMLMLMRRLGPGKEDKSSDSESRPESFISCDWVRAALDSAPTRELRDMLYANRKYVRCISIVQILIYTAAGWRAGRVGSG